MISNKRLILAGELSFYHIEIDQNFAAQVERVFCRAKQPSLIDRENKTDPILPFRSPYFIGIQVKNGRGSIS